MRIGRVAFAVGAALAFAVFIALGNWQVERRAWKHALIARVEQRVQAAPVPAPAVDQWPQVSAAHDEYRRVQVTGTFPSGADTLVQAATDLGAGFWVMTPLRLADGSIVLVNRGFVPSARGEVVALGSGPITVTGLLRLPEPGGGFLRRNDPAANRWYSRDVAAIAAARGLGRVAPYFIDAAEDPNAAPGAPVGGLTVIHFHDNHAVYAITWYTLALMVAGAVWRVWREDRRGRPSASEAARTDAGDDRAAQD